MQANKNRKRKRAERGKIHPRNKYSENRPDFALLASLYPSFEPYVFYTRDGQPRIDWTDFNATRELTRILLLHDHGLRWWIPDGQLCPTVPNRSNYIHWIEDLLSLDIVPRNGNDEGVVRGFDIGTGANCIYPLLGASLLGWSFVGSDVTDVAVEWAEKNVKENPQISHLIEIRKVTSCPDSCSTDDSRTDEEFTPCESKLGIRGTVVEGQEHLISSSNLPVVERNKYHGPPILLGAVRDGEKFDFCMSNPPFFETMEEAGLNPKTSCGGTSEEMVCPGGEKGFITRIIEDSTTLKETFRWYTSMVGRKTNIKCLTSKLWEVGATIVKTTEFVQGQTCRWGLAWSFIPPIRKMIPPHLAEKSTLSFTLEGIPRSCGVMDVLQSVKSFFATLGADCKLNISSFVVDITVAYDQCDAILTNKVSDIYEAGDFNFVEKMDGSSDSHVSSSTKLCIRISVFQQIPGTLLVKGSLQNKDQPVSGQFASVIQHLEGELRQKFCRPKVAAV